LASCAWRSVDPSEQLGWRDLQPTRQFEDRFERRFALAALDPSDGRLVDARRPPELLLSESALPPDALDVGSESGGRGVGTGGHFAQVRRASRIATCQIVIGYLDRSIPIEVERIPCMHLPRSRALVRALHHPVRATLRKRIHGAGEALAVPDLAQALDLALASANYHVRVLAACGLVGFDRAGRVERTHRG
jgi:hypothetical protein